MCIVHCISLLFTHKFRQCCTLQTPPVKHLPKLRSLSYSAVTRAKLTNKPTAKQALLQYNLEGQTQYSKASSIKLTLMVNLYQQHIKSHLPLPFHTANSSPNNLTIHCGELHYPQKFFPVFLSLFCYYFGY